ncbi:MAG: hypothetical protein V1917_02860 [Candidatus Gottesmanbacteria bacterium]
MRGKITLLCILFTVLFFLQPKQVVASSDTAYKDYLYQFDGYRTKLNNFKVARTEYLKYKTLLSETTALDTVKAMLAQRDQLLRSYLLFLNEKLNENTGLSSSDKNLYQTLIQNEVKFLESHAQLIPSIGSLTDATNVSKQLESHYLVLEVSTRQTIIALGLGDLMKLNKQYDTSFSSLRDLAKTNASQTTPQKQSTIDRWILQINNKQQLFQQKTEQITVANGQIKGNSQQEMDALFVGVQKNLAEAKQYLIEGSSYMQELVNLLRYQN